MVAPIRDAVQMRHDTKPGWGVSAGGCSLLASGMMSEAQDYWQVVREQYIVRELGVFGQQGATMHVVNQ